MKTNFLIIAGLLAAALPLQAQAGSMRTLTNLVGIIAIANTNSNNGGNGRNIGNSSATGRASVDAGFLAQAAEDDLHEIALGNLAQANSFNSGVQALGARLVEDGTASFQQAVSIANANGFSIPSDENVKDANDDATLSRLTGSQFDIAFLSEMVKVHSRDIQLFETEAERGRIADVRAFAQAQLPVIATHLSIALTLEDSLGLLPSSTRVQILKK